MQIIRKITDCENLGNSHENIYDRVRFNKVASLQCTDYKQTSIQIFFGICSGNLLSYKEYFRKEFMVYQYFN